uniref:GLOBIN domain-containing protein n=1 Tax=Dracunculus medinensis TaxID=318479 RepID=A0A0N4U0J5_DRAME
LKENQVFRPHVCKFQRFLATIVDLLPNARRNDELVQIIRIVGRQHCEIKTMSFTAEKWLAFKNVLSVLTENTGEVEFNFISHYFLTISLYFRFMNFVRLTNAHQTRILSEKL